MSRRASWATFTVLPFWVSCGSSRARRQVDNADCPPPSPRMRTGRVAFGLGEGGPLSFARCGGQKSRIQSLSSSAREGPVTSIGLEKEKAVGKGGRRVALWVATAFLTLAQGLAVLLFLRHGWQALSFPYPLNYGEGPLLDQSVRLAAFENIYRTNLSAPPYVIANYPPLFMLA